MSNTGAFLICISLIFSTLIVLRGLWEIRQAIKDKHDTKF